MALVLSAANVPDVTLALQVVMFLAVVAAAVPFLRSQRLKGVVAEQAIIIESHQTRLDQLDQDLVDERRARTNAEARAAAAEAAYAELQKYAAPDAFRELISSLARLEKAVETSLSSHGELVLQLVAQSTKLGDMLERHDRGRRGDHA